MELDLRATMAFNLNPFHYYFTISLLEKEKKPINNF